MPKAPKRPRDLNQWNYGITNYNYGDTPVEWTPKVRHGITGIWNWNYGITVTRPSIPFIDVDDGSRGVGFSSTLPSSPDAREMAPNPLKLPMR